MLNTERTEMLKFSDKDGKAPITKMLQKIIYEHA